MNLFEFTASWNVEGGFQISHIYVNAESRSAAKRAIKSKLTDLEGFTLDEQCNTYPYIKREIPNCCIMLWYFDKSNVEHREII
jgi:hypothetical protein